MVIASVPNACKLKFAPGWQRMQRLAAANMALRVANWLERESRAATCVRWRCQQ
jgi:hypothetical protein